MKTTKQELSISDVFLNSELNDLDNIQDHQSNFISAWNGDYIETIFHTDKTYKVVTNLTKLGRSLNTVSFVMHPTFMEWERSYSGDEIIPKNSERVFTKQELIEFHSKNLSKLLTK